jgi:beta-mannosidase
MKKHSLTSLNWELVGTKPHYWRLWDQMKEMRIKHPENDPVKARVPGSVHQSLLDAGIIPDWNIGTNYRDIEWIENRHWLFFADIPNEMAEPGKPVVLRCDGLDDNGEIWLNGEKAGEFSNTHLDYCFDLTPHWKPTGNRLAIIFFSPERYEGQVYWTSKSRIRKPRFYYNWDWCPRILQIGICDDIYIETGEKCQLENIHSMTSFNAQDNAGILRISVPADTKLCAELYVQLSDISGNVIYTRFHKPEELKEELQIKIPDIQPWFPNGMGEQQLYKLTFSLVSSHVSELLSLNRMIGFRSIEWLPCAQASPEADSWLLTVNGTSVFMQGVNWTPIRVMFADVTREMYREYLTRYRDMGANLLRVWGGATLEKACFYELCDELGLMVWQEFPLSSSGICNTPPDDEEAINTMESIVRSYVRRRSHHVSLIAWSGGNELYTADNQRPLDFAHPLLNRIHQVIHEIDPHRRLMPSSPSGPTIYYDPTLNGRGVQWDVHGPWWLPFEPSDEHMTNIREYWESSDALLHSEAGVPGASSSELINRYRGEYDAFPIEAGNPVWGQFSWWIEAEKFEAENGRKPDSLEEYVLWQQQRQTIGLAIAVHAAKKRFPACAGFLIWMGHDCFPCPANTSIIDFEGKKKPVANEIEKIWSQESRIKKQETRNKKQESNNIR